MNNYQKQRFAAKVVQELFNTITNKKIAVFGFAFKKDTGDTRESPALAMIKSFLDEKAHVRVYDPQVPESQMRHDLTVEVGIPEDEYNKFVTVHETAYSAAEDCDAIVVLTEWDEFKELEYSKLYEKMNKPACIFDGRLILPVDSLSQIGFKVFSLGKSSEIDV